MQVYLFIYLFIYYLNFEIVYNYYELSIFLKVQFKFSIPWGLLLTHVPYLWMGLVVRGCEDLPRRFVLGYVCYGLENYVWRMGSISKVSPPS